VSAQVRDDFIERTSIDRYKYWPVRASVGPVRRKTLALGIAMPREKHHLRRIHARGRGPVRFDDGRRANGAIVIHKYLQ
jgi:hypothetical protein